MIRNKITIGNDLLGLVTKVKADAARAVAIKIKAEFNTLLMNTPQYSGNYAANMRIDVGQRAMHLTPEYPYKKYPKALKAKGIMPPIARARKNNNLDTFEERFVTHALGLPVFGPEIQVYNPLRRSKYIEDMPEDRMRSVNKPEGIAVMAKFKARVDKIKVVVSVKVT